MPEFFTRAVGGLTEMLGQRTRMAEERRLSEEDTLRKMGVLKEQRQYATGLRTIARKERLADIESQRDWQAESVTRAAQLRRIAAYQKETDEQTRQKALLGMLPTGEEKGLGAPAPAKVALVRRQAGALIGAGLSPVPAVMKGLELKAKHEEAQALVDPLIAKARATIPEPKMEGVPERPREESFEQWKAREYPATIVPPLEDYVADAREIADSERSAFEKAAGPPALRRAGIYLKDEPGIQKRALSAWKADTKRIEGQLHKRYQGRMGEWQKEVAAIDKRTRVAINKDTALMDAAIQMFYKGETPKTAKAAVEQTATVRRALGLPPGPVEKASGKEDVAAKFKKMPDRVVAGMITDPASLQGLMEEHDLTDREVLELAEQIIEDEAVREQMGFPERE